MSKNKFIKRSLYILTEGHTEQAYFSRLGEILGDEDEWKYSVTVDVREIVDGSKTDPVNMVKEAKKSRKSYDEVWVVFDKDRERDEQNMQAIINNTELTYSVPQTKIINQGEERTIDIQFSVNDQFQVSKLKFQTIKECIYVEL